MENNKINQATNMDAEMDAMITKLHEDSSKMLVDSGISLELIDEVNALDYRVKHSTLKLIADIVEVHNELYVKWRDLEVSEDTEADGNYLLFMIKTMKELMNRVSGAPMEDVDQILG